MPELRPRDHLRSGLGRCLLKRLLRRAHGGRGGELLLPLNLCDDGLVHPIGGAGSVGAGALCNNYASFCCVVHRFGVTLLRSALMWGQFGTLCLDLLSICCVLLRFGANVLRSS